MEIISNGVVAGFGDCNGMRLWFNVIQNQCLDLVFFTISFQYLCWLCGLTYMNRNCWYQMSQVHIMEVCKNKMK